MTKELLQQAIAELCSRIENEGATPLDWPEYAKVCLLFGTPGDDVQVVEALAQQEPSHWRDAVIDQLVVHHSLLREHEVNPRMAVRDLLGMSNSIALAGQVSSDAQALVDRGRREAQQEPACEWCNDSGELPGEYPNDVVPCRYCSESKAKEQPAQEVVHLDSSDALRLKWCVTVLDDIQALGRDEPLGDKWPEIVSVKGAIKRVLQPPQWHLPPTQPAPDGTELVACTSEAAKQGGANVL